MGDNCTGPPLWETLPNEALERAETDSALVTSSEHADSAPRVGATVRSGEYEPRPVLLSAPEMPTPPAEYWRVHTCEVRTAMAYARQRASTPTRHALSDVEQALDQLEQWAEECDPIEGARAIATVRRALDAVPPAPEAT